MEQFSRSATRLSLVACLLIAGVLIRGRASAEMSEANPTYAFASTFGAIGADDKHTCVVRPNGTVRCWGRDMELQLGNDAAMSNSNIPVTVSGLSDVVAIGSGIQHNCVLSSGGAVQCWGDGASGVLGRGSNTDSWSPVAVTGLSSGVTQLSVGLAHTCAVTNTNGLKCWGNGSYGRLGDGTTNQKSVPTDIFPSGSGVIAVSLGNVSTCALFLGGSVQCWGRNYSGQLGTGGTTDSLSPTPVPTLTSGVVAISVGENNGGSGQASHACALMTDGSVKCWGDNVAGQIGDGTTSPRLVPTAVVGLPAPAVGISAGSVHTCAVLDTGALYCWGSNHAQQLGDGTVTPRSQPTQVYGLSSGIAAVAAGSVHTCAMTTTSDVKCWGDNVFGQLGDGTNIVRSQPRDITFNDPGTLPPYTTAPPGSGGAGHVDHDQWPRWIHVDRPPTHDDDGSANDVTTGLHDDIDRGPERRHHDHHRGADDRHEHDRGFGHRDDHGGTERHYRTTGNGSSRRGDHHDFRPPTHRWSGVGAHRGRGVADGGDRIERDGATTGESRREVSRVPKA